MRRPQFARRRASRPDGRPHPVFAGSPTVLGHRGLGRHTVQGYVENTLESFLAAARVGVDWVEVDVRATRDGDLVVMHDPAWDDGVFAADVDSKEAVRRGMLRVRDLLDALPAEVGVDFDLKTSMEDATRPAGRTTAALLTRLARPLVGRRPLAITSFDPAALLGIRAAAPEVPLGLLTWIRYPVDHAVAAVAHLDVDFLALHMGSILPNGNEPDSKIRPYDYIVGLVHDAGREFMAWGPQPKHVPELLAAGADAVCMNDIPMSLAALGRGSGAELSAGPAAG